MKILRSALGAGIAGMIVMSVWSAETNAYGLLGGWIAAFIIIAPMWFMNHYVGLIENDIDASWVDMGLGIGVTGIFRDIFLNHSIQPFIQSLPTLGLVIFGAIIGGIIAALVEKDMAKKATRNTIESFETENNSESLKTESQM